MYYPPYYEESVCRVVRQFKEAYCRIREPLAFVFLTDVHIYKNGRYSVPLIHRICKETGISTVLCGGDFVWAYGSKQMSLDQAILSMEYLDALRNEVQVYIARGNHDVTIRRSAEDATGYTMPYDQVSALFDAHNSPVTDRPDGKIYFYVDDENVKTRYVILDTSEHHKDEDCAWGVENGMEESQLHWLCDKALAVEEGWSVVVLGHIPCSALLPGYDTRLKPLNDLLTAYHSRTSCAYGDFAAAKGKLLFYLCGHNHKDAHAFENGVLHVSTGCDCYCIDDGLPRDVGSVNNVLFDIFLADRATGYVQTFRVGAGNSRFLRDEKDHSKYYPK